MKDEDFDARWTLHANGSPLVQAYMAQAQAESDRRWRALPWYERLRRTLYFHWWYDRERFMGWLHRRLFPDHDW